MLIFLENTTIPAGFPSPSERAHEHRLHIDDLIVRHPEATFFIKMESDAMERLGLFRGDILVVDKSQEPRHGSIVLAMIEDEFVVRRLVRKLDAWYLESSGSEYEVRKLQRDIAVVVWGVVTYSVHAV